MRFLYLLLFLVALTHTSDLVASEKRIALVIGNTNYAHVDPAPNAEMDARDIANALWDLKFEVFFAYNASRKEIEDTLRNYASALSGADVALFYYAGHGIQLNGQNYVIPVDAKLETALDFDFQLLRVDLVLRLLVH